MLNISAKEYLQLSDAEQEEISNNMSVQELRELTNELLKYFWVSIEEK